MLDAHGHPILNNDTRVILKAQYISEVTEKLAYGLVKLSVMFFYRRVFTGTIFNVVSWTMIAIIAAWTMAYFLATVAECGDHVSTAWNYTSIQQLHASCVQTVDLLLSYNVTDIVLDIVILAIPLPMIWRLNMNLKRKLAVSGIFFLGVLSTAASAVRLGIGIYTTQRKSSARTIFLFLQLTRCLTDVYTTTNMSGVITPPMHWSLVGACVALVAACLPTLAPLIRSVWDLRTTRGSGPSDAKYRRNTPSGGFGHNSGGSKGAFGARGAPPRRLHSSGADSQKIQFKAADPWGSSHFQEEGAEAIAMGNVLPPTRDLEHGEIGVEREIEVSMYSK